MVLQESRDCQKGKMESVKLVWLHSCKSIHYWALQMKKKGLAKHSAPLSSKELLQKHQCHIHQAHCSSSGKIRNTKTNIAAVLWLENIMKGGKGEVPKPTNKEKRGPFFLVLVLLLANTIIFPAFLQILWNWYPERLRNCSSQNL